jgi:hypothetical protein
MLERLRSLLRRPAPAGPPQTLRRFGSSDRTVAEDGVSAEHDGWRVDASEAGSVELFNIPEPSVEDCLLTYRAELRSEDVEGGAYLEMWCRLPGQGEFFSKGLHHKAKGTTGWASHEVPFHLRAGQRPDLIRLNVAFDGPGSVWIRNVELQQTPLR